MNAINTNICRWGNSRGIRLPKAVLDIVGFRDDEEVALIAEGDTIIIKRAEKSPAKPYPSLSERFAGYAGDYVPEEWDVGKPVGKEI